MNKNNQCYRMFKLMKEGYANDDLNQVEHGARCWMDLEPNNPFEYNSPEFEAFFQMQKCYMIWRRGDIDRKINRRRMIEWAKTLCSLNPKNPYKFDKKAEEEEEKLLLEQKTKEVKITEKVVLDEPKKVFGVPSEEDQEKEKKSWLQFLFPWKKVGE